MTRVRVGGFSRFWKSAGGATPAPHQEETLHSTEVRTLAGRIGITERVILVIFAAIWIVDGILKFQPDLVGRAFVTTVIDPMAVGQPAPLAWLIIAMGRFIAPDAGVWVVLFGILEIAIGVGLLYPRFRKLSLVSMFVWIFVISLFGEGLEMFFTGSASTLTGAPGVLTYALIGITLWPSSSRSEIADAKTGLDSAAASSGLGGMNFALIAWAALWSLFAVLWVMPKNRASNSFHDAIVNAADGEPGWYATFLHDVARGLATSGTQCAWLMMMVSLVIGFGPLVSKRAAGFLVAGAVLELVFWITGQALGELMTGGGTDPNAGPMVVLFALSLLPTAVSVTNHPVAPLRLWMRSHSTAVVLNSAILLVALIVSASYPAVSSGSSSKSSGGDTTSQCMAGMIMSGCIGKS